MKAWETPSNCGTIGAQPEAVRLVEMRGYYTLSGKKWRGEKKSTPDTTVVFQRPKLAELHAVQGDSFAAFGLAHPGDQQKKPGQ
jgi:hypothetical protein